MAEKLGILLIWFVVLICAICSWITSSWSVGSDVASPIAFTSVMKIKQNEGKHFIVQFLSHQNSVFASILAGLISLLGCWTLTYFNWLHVGTFPATPLSPNRDNCGSVPTPAILSSFGVVPLLVSLTTSFYTWSLLSNK